MTRLTNRISWTCYIIILSMISKIASWAWGEVQQMWKRKWFSSITCKVYFLNLVSSRCVRLASCIQKFPSGWVISGELEIGGVALCWRKLKKTQQNQYSNKTNVLSTLVNFISEILKPVNSTSYKTVHKSLQWVSTLTT